MFHHRGFCHDAEALHFKIVTLCTLFALSTFGPCTITGTHNPAGYDFSSSENCNQIPPQTTIPKLNLENVCMRSDLFCFPSTLSGFFTDFHSQEANLSGLSKVKPDNTLLSKSMPPLNNHVNVVSCSLKQQETAQIDEIAPQPRKDEYFRIKSSLMNDFSSPHVEISHHILDWGQKYLHFPSLSFLTIKNQHNLSSLTIYDPYSTNFQFYPCNHTETNETTSICFIFNPKSLGLTLGHLILQTSSGGFLIQTRGFAIESPLSISLNLLMPCDATGTKSVSLLVQNNGPDVVTVVKIHAIGENLESFRTKFVEGLILFPNSVTEVGMVMYDVNRDDNLRCKLLVETNKSDSPKLEVSCGDIAGVCSRFQNDGVLNYDDVDRVLPPLGIKATDMTKYDESVLGNWKSQGTNNNKMLILTNIELTFPIVHINTHQSKYIHVINPTNQPVRLIMQLLLNSGEIITNCQKPDQILHPSLSLNSQNTPARYGFSIPEHAVTEAYDHPRKKAILGPVFSHPSSQCIWTSSALVRNNLSGVEWVSLRGSGGLPGLVLLNGSDPVNTVRLEHRGYGQRSVKVLFAKNTGDLPVEIEKVTVSGTKCEWDGFMVGNCNGFGLLSRELRKVMVSYRADLCAGLVRRELEFVMSGGILVVPVEVGISTAMLTICKRSLFWIRVEKLILAVFVSVFLIFMACSCTVSFVIRDGNLPKMSSGQEECSSDVCPKPDPAKIQPEIVAVVEAENPDNLTVKTGKDKARRRKKKRGSGSGLGSGLTGQFEVSSSHSSNSTPSSPLSPPSSLTPKRSLELSHVRAKSPVKSSIAPLVKKELSVSVPALVKSSGPHARAPGSERKVIRMEESVSDDRYKYIIWDDHLRVLPDICEGSLFAMNPQELFTNVRAFHKCKFQKK